MVDFNSITPMTIVNVIGVNIGTVKSYEVRRPKYILFTRNYKKGFPELRDFCSVLRKCLDEAHATLPHISHDLPLPPEFNFVSTTYIVSDYSKKLCQWLLCLRKGHLSSVVLNLKTS